MKKNIILTIVLILIVASIFGLELLKPHMGATVRKDIALNAPAQNQEAATRIAAKSLRYPKAIELVQPDGYINSAPFNLSDEIGKKVIIVDFWTYSCINCQRTLPYMNAWYNKYKDGLLIVGVHTPEFDFEKDYSNVQRAVQKFGIQYPVVQDNAYKTWTAYNNQYWPHKYIIDIDGFIIYDHIGEGNYAETEDVIKQLLDERRQVLGLNMTLNETNIAATMPEPDLSTIKTEEIYFGYAFSRGQFAQSWKPDQIINYTAKNIVEQGKFYLDGLWRNNPDNMEAVSEGSVFLRYNAAKVNIVAGADAPSVVQVFVDGVPAGNVTVSSNQLYTVVNGKAGEHLLELRAKGVKFYTFTFG